MSKELVHLVATTSKALMFFIVSHFSNMNSKMIKKNLFAALLFRCIYFYIQMF